MRTVILNVGTLKDSLSAFRNAFSTGEAEGDARISFASPELLWKVLTAKRWEILQMLASKEPMSIRAAARAVDRDVKGVHSDLVPLIEAGIVRKTDDGLISFPFDAVHVDFMLETRRPASAA
jgi:predicted transcriptional regulator